MNAKIICLGEAMGEISVAPGGTSVNVGGDTFNTAIYMVREGLTAGFASAIGPDPFGKMIRDRLGVEGVADLLFESPEETGLYAITTAPDGERSFYYWRAQAAARGLLRRHGSALAPLLAETEGIYLSGITLWVLEQDAEALLGLLRGARAGGTKVMFDGNYRPRLWDGQEDRARELFAEVMALSDMVFPTFEDEQLLWQDGDPQAVIDRILALGPQLVVLKQGAQGCILATPEGQNHVPVPQPVTPLDTTAAGDSFNAAFLAALWSGASAQEAALAGHRLAGKVIRHRGALI
ncbi:sugar kinase [Pseudooceanicola sp. HF7]|uniref:sugar kinase n=1 Tax=Pseudooceanicola sp. HF7 TaxID=2721560 RepID=UPI00142F63F7|nr:sugar kinase [Pseudooceanicola sp. HF7]NIZ10920.1 sugar kinase [Pseudooceanicola sp. HF7]